MKANERVRLKGDPSSIGFTTERSREERGRHLMLVRFPERDRWVPADQLEIVSAQETPLDLLLNRRFGDASDLRRTITHVRLTGRLADVIYSMEATNTDFYAYQFKPVLKILLSPSNGILIADEVGLGKTIEAGLIWTELRSRFDMKRLVVLCPAILREKWQMELERRMGVVAEIVDARDVLNELKSHERQERGFALIASFQGLRPPRGWQNEENDGARAELARFLEGKENEDKLIDLLVIDEAHYLRNPETQTNQLGQQFRNVAEYCCFLSATPVHNQSSDLFALLNLLDPETFRRIDDFKNILEANAPLVKARDLALRVAPDRDKLIALLEQAQAHPLLNNNRQLAFLHEFIQSHDIHEPEHRSHLAYRLETVNLLGHAVTRTRKREVKEWRVIREPVDEPIPMSDEEKRFYETVTQVVEDYGISKDINIWFLLATPQRMLTSSMPAAFRSWKEKGLNFNPDEEDWDDVGGSSHNGIGPLSQRLVEAISSQFTFEMLAENDSKYLSFKTRLKQLFADHPDEKVVLFSTFRATLKYLSQRLSSDGLSNVVLQGGMDNKDEVIRSFSDPSGPKILLSSEVGGEGIDLQFCRLLVNYDLPWNPMRVEQRIGRLDRIGQKAEKILIWNLIYEGTIDARVYRRLYQKLDLCRQALGDFEAILGDEIKKLEKDLLTGKLTPEQQSERIDQTAIALENRRIQEEKLESEASQLVHYGDYILNQIRAARDLHRWISDRDLCTYVVDYLRQTYPGGTFQQISQEPLDYEIALSDQAKFKLEEFIKKEKLTKSGTRLTQPSSSPVRCRFQNKAISEVRQRIETISQFHPLVRFVSHDIEAQELKLRPAVAIRIPKSVLPERNPGIYIVAGSRWSVSGLQTSERLVFLGTHIDSGTHLSESEAEQLAVLSAMDGQLWSQAVTQIDADHAHDIATQDLFGELRQKYEEYIKEIGAHNEDRIDVQLRTLEIHRQTQLEKLSKVLAGHLFEKRDSLVKATEGKIKALNNRIQSKVKQLECSRAIQYDFEEVFVAIVQVI